MPAYSDSSTFADAGSYTLANAFKDTARATDADLSGGSLWHLSMNDTARVADAFLGGGTNVMEDTAHVVDALVFSRSLPMLDVVHVADTLTAGGIEAAAVAERANARDTTSAVKVYAPMADAAHVADALVVARGLALRDTGHAADSLTLHGTLRQTMADFAHAVDSLQKPAVTLGMADTAHVGEALTLAVSIPLVMADVAHVADALTLKRASALALLDTAGVHDAFTARMTAQGVFDDTAEAQDAMRGVFASLPNLWLNSTTVAASLWDGVPFNSMVEKDGVLYGAGVEGLYAFTDRTGTWRGEVVWDLSDFDSAQRKRLLGVYVAGQAGGAFTVRISNEQGSFDYDARYPGAGPMNHRAIPGRGLDSRYYRIAVVNTQDFGVNSVLVVHQETVRKI